MGQPRSYRGPRPEQQRGNWGGHRDFAEAYIEREAGIRKDEGSAPLPGTIVWWPEPTAKR